MKSKTKIEKQISRKGNSELIDTVILAKKNKEWLEVAGLLASSRRQRVSVNLSKLNDNKEGEVLIVPGKVLSQGEINKKIKVAALSFSEKAREKLLNSKSEILSILEEIKKNPSAKGVRIVR